MSITERLKKQEEQFKEFRTEIKPVSEGIGEQFVFRDKNDVFVGDVICIPSDNQYQVGNIWVSPKYRDRGFSKFMYKYALEHYQGQGAEGLIVGANLVNRLRTQETYKNFIMREYNFSDSREPRMLMTDWVHKN